mmetsp:Transcript_16187/g.2684  ORF Transcript_16187/g.2684 Transcript_16187/m.2684 type:complete len:95 (-) Transcript_16187:151-435(-)
MISCKISSFLLTNLPVLLRQINLIPNQKHTSPRNRVVPNLINPILAILERLSLINIIYQYNPVSLPIKPPRNASEHLLPSSISYLHFYSFRVML